MPSLRAEPPQLPTASSLLRTVKSSCSTGADAAGIRISEQAVDSLISEYVEDGRRAATARDYSLTLPLKWDSNAAEVNFLALLAVLTSLGPSQSYLDALPGSLRRTAASEARHLLLGLYLSAPPDNHLNAASPLSSSHLAQLGAGEIADTIGVKIHQEKSVAHIPVATLAERGGPGSEIVETLRHICNVVGTRLVDNHYVDLGAFVVETLGQSKLLVQSHGEEAAIGHFVHRTVSLLEPVLADSHTLVTVSPDPQPVHIYKNCLFMLFALALRFQPAATEHGAAPKQSADAAKPGPLPWLPSVTSPAFTLFADEEMFSALLSRGIFDLTRVSQDVSNGLSRLAVLSSASTSSLSSDTILDLTADEANILRAATVSAGETARQRLEARSLSSSVVDLDAFLRRSSTSNEEKTPSRHLRISVSEIANAGYW